MQWETPDPDPGQALRAKAQADLELAAAAEYLKNHGLRILDQNWQSPGGHLDIVAAEGRCLVVCQVKTRSPRTRAPLKAITQAKARRLRRLAAAWLAARDEQFEEIRIDTISLTKDPAGGFTIEQMRGGELS